MRSFGGFILKKVTAMSKITVTYVKKYVSDYLDSGL